MTSEELLAKLIEKGALPTNQPFGYQHILPTKYGEYAFTVRKDSLHGMFLDVKRLAEDNYCPYQGPNPYSGKWNFYWDDDASGAWGSIRSVLLPTFDE